jgi:isopropylmalate/homocitrate/citramalate synthase
MALDRSKVWTGAINEQALEPQPRGIVGLHDTTLRDGAQAVRVAFTPNQTLELARALDAAGIDRIEVATESVESIVAAGLHAEIWGYAPASLEDIDALVELGVQAVVIEGPMSDLEQIEATVSHAVQLGARVAFGGADASRADLEGFDRAYAAAVDAGASEIVVADTLGIATPEAAALLVSRALEHLDVPVHWHGHDDFGLGTAAAIAAVQAGATWVHGTINGMGERAGNADLVEVALALEALYGIPTRLDLAQARALSRLVARRTHTRLTPWKAVTGDALFTGQSPYAPELVGAEDG